MTKSAKVSTKAELAGIHDLLDALQVSGGQAHERLLWLIHEGIQARTLTALQERVATGDKAMDKLKKMAALYEQEHGPDTGRSTTPWQIVRWVKEMER